MLNQIKTNTGIKSTVLILIIAILFYLARLSDELLFTFLPHAEEALRVQYMKNVLAGHEYYFYFMLLIKALSVLVIGNSLYRLRAKSNNERICNFLDLITPLFIIVLLAYDVLYYIFLHKLSVNYNNVYLHKTILPGVEFIYMSIKVAFDNYIAAKFLIPTISVLAFISSTYLVKSSIVRYMAIVLFVGMLGVEFVSSDIISNYANYILLLIYHFLALGIVGLSYAARKN